MPGRPFLSATLVALLLGLAVPAIAAESRANPYRNLFKPRDLKEVARAQQARQTPARPRVVCGMTVIPADPAIDPKIAIEPKKDGTRYTIRVVPPAVCNN